MALTLWTAEVSACPQCAQNKSGDNASLFLLWGMILLPLIVAAVVYPILKKLCRPEDGSSSPAQDGVSS